MCVWFCLFVSFVFYFCLLVSSVGWFFSCLFVVCLVSG